MVGGLFLLKSALGLAGKRGLAAMFSLLDAALLLLALLLVFLFLMVAVLVLVILASLLRALISQFVTVNLNYFIK